MECTSYSEDYGGFASNTLFRPLLSYRVNEANLANSR
jgi:hypothetical protein